jgi:hypothetical protein
MSVKSRNASPANCLRPDRQRVDPKDLSSLGPPESGPASAQQTPRGAPPPGFPSVGPPLLSSMSRTARGSLGRGFMPAPTGR